MLDDLQEKSLLSWEEYWAILRRRRWWLLMPFFLGWATVWTIAWFLPPVYRSGTLILVEQQKVPDHYVVSNVASDLQERLQSMTQQILSRTRLQRVIQDFRLYMQERPVLSPNELVARMRKDIEIELVRSPGRRGELTAFKIYYSAPNPQVAQQVASELTSLFIEENLRVRQRQSEDTTAFLEDQLEQARQQLAQQEEQVREFKSRYLGQLPEQLESNIQILAGLQSRLESAHAASNRAEQQNLYLGSLLGQYRSLQTDLGRGTVASARLPPALDAELDRLEAQLADLRARYTERHPDMMGLKEKITETKQLKQQIEVEIAAARNESASESSANMRATNQAELQAISPMMQIESQRKANQLEIENRQREIKELEARIERYQARLNLAPLREQQLTDLTRDYKQSRANYESLLGKKMHSELATSLEKRQQGEQFRILDPPDLPKKPYRPDRLNLSWVGLVVGAMLGLGSAAGAELTDDRIHSDKDLGGLVPVAVLAGIPPLRTTWEQRRRCWRRRLEWLGGTLLVAAMVAANFLAYYWG